MKPCTTGELALVNLAKTKEGKEAEELYNQAFEKYQKATEIKPDALYNTYLGNKPFTTEILPKR